jgi:hypothetical protein
MELMDSTMVNLKVLSKLEPETKLETDGVLFQSVEWSIFPEWARRYWGGHSRIATVNKIKQLYKNAFALVKSGEQVDRIINALRSSIQGLKNLKATYSTDTTVVSQIDVVIDDIETILENYNENENT